LVELSNSFESPVLNLEHFIEDSGTPVEKPQGSWFSRVPVGYADYHNVT
jgi:hypothetical protein